MTTCEILFDAVEERSDQNVNEYTVSALIDVKRYMTPLLLLDASKGIDDMIIAISENIPKAPKSADAISVKINECVHNVHSLQDPYNNFANRGEMTKEKIHNAIEHGVFEFEMTSKEEHCRAQMTYTRDEKPVIYGLDELRDLKSRALLIASSKSDTQEEHASTPSHFNPDLHTFIECVNTVESIVHLCKNLIDLGHFDFREFKNSGRDLERLRYIYQGLKQIHDDWQKDIREARQTFYFLNFFQSKQLGLLDQFFSRTNEVTDDLVLLFKFVNPNVRVESKHRSFYQVNVEGNPKSRLLQLGRVLEDIFKDSIHLERKIPGLKRNSRSDRDHRVTPGEVFVAELDTGSTRTINV